VAAQKHHILFNLKLTGVPEELPKGEEKTGNRRNWESPVKLNVKYVLHR
jgi:hypothetical protein